MNYIRSKIGRRVAPIVGLTQYNGILFYFDPIKSDDWYDLVILLDNEVLFK
jgi:hypothetical protein